MIPREILKKNRQIKIRPSCIVDTVLARASFQSPVQFCGVSGMVPNSQNLDLPMFRIDCEINGKWPRLRQSGLPGKLGKWSESFRILRQGLQEGQQRIVKSQANARLPGFVPVNGLIPFPLGLNLRNYPERHFLAGKRFLISADTSSIGLPRPGCFKASSARRSSSVFSTSVSSSSKSPNSKSMISTSSRRSASGIRRSSSRISVLLMPPIYSGSLSAQAAFSELRNQ